VEGYHTYEEGSHFISCLLLADSHLRQGSKDEGNVRWIVLSLHDALYALLIDKQTRTDGFGIFNDKFEQEVVDFYEKGLSSNSREFSKLNEKSFKENLAGIGKLLKRTPLDPDIEIRVKDIESLTRPSRGLSRLKELWDFLSHPRPMTAAYSEDYVCEACLDTLAAIRRVNELSGN
jgi:hypothetical protein